MRIFGAVAGVVSTAGTNAQPLFTLKAIAPPSGYHADALAFNNQGEMTGRLWVGDDTAKGAAFYYSHGRYKRLGSLGGDSWGAGINEMGEIAGASTTSGLHGLHGVVWTRGRSHDLGTLPGGDMSRGCDINSRGEVTGYATGADGRYHAFIYAHGKMKVIEGLPGDSFGNAINDLGEVVGEYTTNGPRHAFLYSHGKVIDLGAHGIAFEGAADINIWGEIAGTAATGSGEWHAYVYSDGEIVDISPGANGASCAGINRWSQVVGTVPIPDEKSYAFFYSGLMHNLNDLVVEAHGARLMYGVAINDAGQILCRGVDASGQEASFLLTPLMGPGCSDR